MNKTDESKLSVKLLSHTKLKLSACLFMLMNNIREIKAAENPFNPYEKPDTLSEIENLLITTVRDLSKTLELPTDARLQVTNELQAAKIKLEGVCEAYFSYYYMLQILGEVVSDCNKLKHFEDEKPVAVDFHAFIHDIIDFIEKDEATESQSANISLMMECFPLLMTKDKFNEYVENSLKLAFQEESREFVNHILKSLKARFLPVKLEYYGSHTPRIKDYFQTLIGLQFEKMTVDELAEILDGLVDMDGLLENIISHLSIIHESLNFAILVTVFAKDLEYLLDNDATRKDAFHYTVESLDKSEDEALSENADDMYENILSTLMDEIIADEKSGLLEQNPDKIKGYSEPLREVYEINQLISNIFYELLSDIVFKGSKPDSHLQSDKAFLEESCKEFISYVNSALEGISPANARHIKRLFLSSIPSPFTVAEFVDYADYVLSNTAGYSKNLLILDKAGRVFESTGFVESTDEHNHENGCDCGSEHHHI